MNPYLSRILGELKGEALGVYGGFRKLVVPYFGVLKIGILFFRVLY